MSFNGLLFVSLILSMVTISLLALHDPKRRRNLATGDDGRAYSSRVRKALTAVLLLPATVLLPLAGWSALIIWFGGVTIFGWLITLSLARISSKKIH